MLVWLIAFIVAIASFALLAGWLWLPARQRITRQHGLAALADMHWRDFSHLVRRALIEKRGMQPVGDVEQAVGEPSADWLMQHNNQPWLVSCKHGLSYRIGEAAVVELGTKIRLAGANGGVLLTQGSVSGEGRELAARHQIEIIDGPALWSLLRPYLPGELESNASEHGRSTSLRRTGIAALGSLAIGLLSGIGLGNTLGDESAGAGKDTQPAPSTIAAGGPAALPATDAAAQTPAPKRVVHDPVPTSDPAQWLVDGIDIRVQDPDPDLLRRYQQQVSRLLANTEGLHSAIWMTQTTVTVDRAVDEVRAMELICPVLHRYPSLRTVRVQLNPRLGTQEQVRWRQCSIN
jgi:hypothetical protein